MASSMVKIQRIFSGGKDVFSLIQCQPFTHNIGQTQTVLKTLGSGHIGHRKSFPRVGIFQVASLGFHHSSRVQNVEVQNEAKDSLNIAGLHGKQGENKKAKDEKVLWWTKFSMASFGLMCMSSFGYLVALWGPPPRDDEGLVIEDELTEKNIVVAYVLRTMKELKKQIEETQAPSRVKLLPDPLQEPYYQPPYTLVIEMTDLLVHPEYDWKHGWRFKKRPGVDYFLQQVAPPMFEIVIYTSENGHTAWPVLDSLDKNGMIMYRLFRDATRYEKGEHIKELKSLNRDLTKVIAVDWNRNAQKLTPENSLIIRRWTGDMADKQLVDLGSFLQTIAASGIDDVRTVLVHYSNEEDPLATFAENQRKLREVQAEEAAAKVNTQYKSSIGGWSSWLGGSR